MAKSKQRKGTKRKAATKKGVARRKTSTRKTAARKASLRKRSTKPVAPKLETDTSTKSDTGATMYKVIQRDGTGGHTSMKWTPHLPTANGPGKPATVPTNRALSPCSYGLHVTKTPNNWGAGNPGARVFEAEVYGPYRTDGDKICAYKIVLTKEVFRPKPVVNPFVPYHQLNVAIKPYPFKK